MANFTQQTPPSSGGGGGGKRKKGGSAAVVAGGTLPVQSAYVEPRCKICMGPHRREIDMMLASGWSQKSVIEYFNGQLPEDQHYTPNNISTHKNKHLTSQDAAVRRIMETRARQFGMDVDAIEGMILTHEATLEMIVQQGLEALRAGLTSSEPRDVIQAVQMLKQIEADFSATALDELEQQFKAFMDAVSEVVNEDQGRLIFRRTQELLAERELKLMRPQLPPPEVIESTVTDEE